MIGGTAVPSYTRSFWAKARPYRARGPSSTHLLEHHLADVGACLEALLAQPTIRRRLARAAGRDELDDVTVARLCVFAALHDIGKVNVGFQTQVWRRSDFGERPVPRHAGHTRDLVPVLVGADQETHGWFFDALGWDDFTGWDCSDRSVSSDLLVATLSHHGLPLVLEGDRQPNPGVWRRFESLDPEAYVRRVGQLIRDWFPNAWHRASPPLPRKTEFQHMFLGLCTLADWLGSNERWFPYKPEPDCRYIESARNRAQRAVVVCGLDIHAQREAFCKQGELPGFSNLFELPSANAIQHQAAITTPLNKRLVVIESETGSGKTEAALWRFARLFADNRVDGMYFALPTRAAALQIHNRIEKFVSNAFSINDSPEVVLAVPGYLRSSRASGQTLPHYEVWWDDHPDGMTQGRRWAAERANRYLAAQIAVGTVDQAMLSILKVKHSHMRAVCLARNLLVVDEVHASDTYMGVILRALLDAHLRSGGYALLMSATLGSVARRRWLAAGTDRRVEDLPLEQATDSPYPAVTTRADSGEQMTATRENGQQKTVQIEACPLMGSFDNVAERALQAAREGAKVLVVRNTVGHAVLTQQALERVAGSYSNHLLFSSGRLPTLHHGRFAGRDRRLLDRLVENYLGKHRQPLDHGLVVVGTQTLEQSLDLDADLLVTDLCPVDVLLQRIGRLHRHSYRDRPPGYGTPSCIVLLPGLGDLTPLLRQGINGLNQFVYPDLRCLEATRRMVDTASEWVIPAMNRELVERATHPAALDAITKELGGEWWGHDLQVAGVELADGLKARDAIVARSKSFYYDNHDVVFGSMEERIRTRLGDEGIDIELDSPQPSPFGVGRILRMIVPRRWLPQTWEDYPAAPDRDADGFAFAVGGRTFHYSRLGLHRRGA